MSNKRTPEQHFIRRLVANAEGYHTGALSHEDFTAEQWHLWDEINAAGSETREQVLAELRRLEKL